jgi:hypothetical protein
MMTDKANADLEFHSAMTLPGFDGDNTASEQLDKDIQRLQQLEIFAGKLVAKRREAIDGRAASGIEIMWKQDDEYYDGIDDANRAELMVKPTTSQGRLTSGERDNHSTRSNVFVNITQPYVDIATARAADMALPVGDRPFGLTSVPDPDVIDATKNHKPMPAMDGAPPPAPEPEPAAAQPPAAEGAPPQAQPQAPTIADAAHALIAHMNAKAQKAEDKIWSWLVQSRWQSEMRKVIEQASRIGVGCLKGPFPTKRKQRAMCQDAQGNLTVKMNKQIIPASKAIDVWNLYPDPSCGDDIHNGSYIFEKDVLTASKLKALKGTGYIDSEIDKVLKEGPDKRNLDSRNPTLETDNFEIWYFHGDASMEDFQSASQKEVDYSVDTIPVVCTMVNDRIIKASQSIVSEGDFPYDLLVWQRRANTWAGTGVARQVRTAQRMVNAASRNLMDNAGISAGPQIIMKTGLITPVDGVWEITPLKIWKVDEDADVAQVQHAIMSIVIPTMQAELTQIIRTAMEFAEKSTSMPLILQGQQGTATETVGGMNILNNNSNTVLRRIARIFDESIVEPHILRYYDYLMAHCDDEDVKGDYVIEAKGSTALYERDAQNQMIMQLIPIAANPAFGINPDLLMQEILKIGHIQPERVCYTPDEKNKMAQEAKANPPTDPKTEGAKQVAKIRVDGEIEKAKLVQSSDQKELQMREDETQSEMAAKLHRLQMELDHKERMKQVDKEIEMMRLSQQQNISLEQVKAQLASVTMKLTTQKELTAQNLATSQQDTATSQHDSAQERAHAKLMQDKEHQHEKDMQAITPPTEPVGKADNGQSWEG